MGNSSTKTKGVVMDALTNINKSTAMTIEEIISMSQPKLEKLYEYIIDPLKINGIPVCSAEELSTSFSIATLSKNVCAPLGKEPASEFEAIQEFLKCGLEEALPEKKSNEISGILRDGLKEFQLEIEGLEKNLDQDDERTQKRKVQLKKFGSGLNDWDMKKGSEDWKSISSQLLEFIESHDDYTAFNEPKDLEVYITALCLYAFVKLRRKEVSQANDERCPSVQDTISDIQHVIEDACKLLRACLRDVTYHNAEASFKREQNPYHGFGEIPGCGPADILCGLHTGLKSSTIQKFLCEDDQIISFQEVENFERLKFGFSKLQVHLPNKFHKNDKGNNMNFIIDIRIPVQYTLDTYDSLGRMWDHRKEVWQFKPNEHHVYISPLVFKAIYEISAICSVTHSNETEVDGVEPPDYSKLAKTFERKLWYRVDRDFYGEVITEVQEPWKVFSTN